MVILLVNPILLVGIDIDKIYNNKQYRIKLDHSSCLMLFPLVSLMQFCCHQLLLKQKRCEERYHANVGGVAQIVWVICHDLWVPAAAAKNGAGLIEGCHVAYPGNLDMQELVLQILRIHVETGIFHSLLHLSYPAEMLRISLQSSHVRNEHKDWGCTGSAVS